MGLVEPECPPVERLLEAGAVPVRRAEQHGDSADFPASLEAVRKLLDGSIPALPHFGFNMVDVRDIAALQLLAMTTHSAAGQHFIGSCVFYWMADIAKIQTGVGRQGAESPVYFRPGFSRPRDCDLRPGCARAAVRAGEAATSLAGKGAQMLGWMTAAGP